MVVAYIFVTFWHGGPVQPGRDSTVGRFSHISWPAGCSWHLSSTWSSEGQHQQGVERSQSLWTLPCKNSKKMLHFLDLYILCWHLYFVDAFILSTPIILWAPIFWWKPVLGGHPPVCSTSGIRRPWGHPDLIAPLEPCPLFTKRNQSETTMIGNSFISVDGLVKS
jgi:hypothetical protein